MKVLLFPLTVFVTVVSCNSNDSKISQQIDPCQQYEYSYNQLQRHAKNMAWEARNGNRMVNFQDSIEQLKNWIAWLDTMGCKNKKDIKFATDAILQLENRIKKNGEQDAEEYLNGDDWFMSGVKIASYKIVYDDLMNPYAQVKISNQTRRTLRSLKFGINVCGNGQRTIYCQKSIIVRALVRPFSEEEMSFPITAAMNSRYKPKIELFEIIREDGTKAKTREAVAYESETSESSY
ncbi:MAG: hypothetical protein ACTHMD_01060 [Flavisolibacter sp.]